MEVLESIIKRDETNAAPRKRRVAILKARGRIPEAIKELTEYLKRSMTYMIFVFQYLYIFNFIKLFYKIKKLYTYKIELITYYGSFRFMSDQEAWHELCDLYLQEQEYSKAAYCMEELLLHNPHSHLIYQRYAEIKYSQVIHRFRIL